MSAYTDFIDAASDASGPLRKQVTRAVLQVAQDIANEPATVQFHLIRAGWAFRIRFGGLGAASDAAARMIVRVLENPTIAANPNGATDQDVQFVVESIVNSFIDKG